MRRLTLFFLCSCGLAEPFVGSRASIAAAQQSTDALGPDSGLTLNVRMLFYGDNTEFANPFAEGQTLLGTFALAFVEAPVSDRLALRAGVFGNQRFGSRHAFDQVRPVLAFVIGGRRSRLVLGTLDTVRRLDGAGPDRIGPHDLLPPLQRQTLAFERPWEAGLQWTLNANRVTQDAWIHWQRVNTRRQRELFDVGLTHRVRLRRALTLRTDLHYVHQGGQLSARSAGPVADNVAVAAGVDVGGPAGPFDRVSLEMFALLSHDVPDRERPDSRTGAGSFVRAAAENARWRAHAILWRGDDFIAREGDPLYQSVRADGRIYRGVRDYAEVGLTRTFRLASRSSLEMSARWHRVERDYGYSYRVLAIADLRKKLTQ